MRRPVPSVLAMTCVAAAAPASGDKAVQEWFDGQAGVPATVLLRA